MIIFELRPPARLRPAQTFESGPHWGARRALTNRKYSCWRIHGVSVSYRGSATLLPLASNRLEGNRILFPRDAMFSPPPTCPHGSTPTDAALNRCCDRTASLRPPTARRPPAPHSRPRRRAGRPASGRARTAPWTRRSAPPPGAPGRGLWSRTRRPGHASRCR